MPKKRSSDDAREYRARFQEEIHQRTQPQALSGLTTHPWRRFIYLRLNGGETPGQQRKAVFAHWKELYKEHGNFLTGIMDQTWLLTVPGGEAFCDFCVSNPEEQKIPRLERAVALLRAFAAITGRCTAIIEDESIFVCDDGRRFSLEECSYRLLTDADYRATRKAKSRVRS